MLRWPSFEQVLVNRRLDLILSTKALFGFPTCQLIPVFNVQHSTFVPPESESTSTANTMAMRPDPWVVLVRLLWLVQSSANAFPHLESVVGALIGCLDVVQVSHSRFLGYYVLS